ncbi:MAG: hypothetical protein Kow00124_08010 [Anaerolineae bacterium]
MAETAQPAVVRPRQLYPGRVPLVLFQPRRLFEWVTAEAHGVWLTPILLLTLTTLLRVVVAGVIRQADPAAGQVALPPDFQYYSPEQQAQFMQAAQATSGPAFTFVFPALGGVLGVWLGWLIVGGLVHLVLTMLGGRGSTTMAMNVVAWASVPFAVRDLVRVLAMIISGKTIAAPGLSGFIASDAAGVMLFLSALLALIDLYLIWHIVLLVLGSRVGDPSLSRLKVNLSIWIIMILMLAIQGGVGFLGAQLATMNVMRPFFF